MDEEEIYANVEEPSGAQIYWKRAQSGSGNIYVNEDTGHVVEPNDTLSGLEESNTVKQRFCIATALILGLLCLLLLAGLMILVFLYTNGNSNWEIKMLRLQTSYNNLTEKKHQLQTNYNNLTEKKHQLQTNYNNLTEKKHQLQTNYNNLAKENHQLQTNYNNLAKENHQLQTNYNNLAKENHQLKTSYDNLTAEKAQLKQKLEDAAIDLRRKLQALHWTYFADRYYYISSTMQTWQDSRNDCLQKGADLVIINSPEEQQFIRSRKTPIWIGLTDAEREGTWKWVDGTLLGNQRYWAKSEPNNANGNENCAEISSSNLEKSWNDVRCDFKMYWVCEKQLT